MSTQSTIGSAVTLEQLEKDPYPVFDRMRTHEPVSWVNALNMWYVVNHDDVQTVLRDCESFSVGTPHSLLFDTFGEHMLTVQGAAHQRFRSWFRGPFAPARIREAMETNVSSITERLIEGFRSSDEVELRSALASRLPILVMLDLFGLPPGKEALLRRLYDNFEAALANFTWDEAIRRQARLAVGQFHALVRDHIESLRRQPRENLLNGIVNTAADDRLTDDEIVRNTSIIFFGGISTVEALILNSVFALCTNEKAMGQVRSNPEMVGAVIDETMRWLSPVQSATRHVIRPATVGGITFNAGETVNCMIGAANRDPSVFADPDSFLLGRPNANRHVGFAVGPHFCLGLHLARLEARAVLEHLLKRSPRLSLAPGKPVNVRGFEFRQPEALHLVLNQ